MSYTKTNWQNEPSTATPLSAENLNHMEQGIYDAQDKADTVEAMLDALQAREEAATAAAMTDTSKVYIYTGSEAGYTFGDWYYYNGSAWVSGGAYNSTALNTDTSLSVQGAPADAKATGKAVNTVVSELKNTIYTENGYEAYKLPYYIDSNNLWTNSAAFHVMIPVKPGDSVYIEANNSYNTYFAVLTTFDIPTANSQVPKFSTGSGFTNRITVPKGNNATYTMPSDAEYLYFSHSVNANIYYPSFVTINGIDVNMCVKEQIQNVLYNVGLENGTDLDTIYSTGSYRLGAGSTYPNQPVSGGRRILFVSSKYPLSASYQVLIKCDTGEIFMRMYHDAIWDPWKTAYDATATKIALGSNPYRKTLDHGGFYDTRYGKKLIYQNSPESFITSMREGIVFHNLDIVFSSDGVPFVSHDVSVQETGGTTININNLTYAQIKQYYIGDQDYSWKLQTLAECASFIKKIGGVIDMVDVTAANNATQIANAGNLPQYYRDNNIKPTWTNFDYDGMRDAFITNGPEFGLYFVCNSEATILSAIAYVQAHTEHKKYLMNIGSSTEAVRLAIESRIGIVSGLGITMYAYTYNKSNVGNVPRWADGVVSEDCNVNYENWLANMP